jgi:O-acetyl-ADP-ribose deacetylase (regulator of RNase III)
VEGRAVPLVSVSGSVVESDADILVNTVNVVGVMGKGVALAFKERFPEIMGPYRAACRSGALAPGGVLFVDVRGRTVACVATKAHWRDPSRYEWVESCLRALAAGAAERGAASVALPPPGCGNGGLDWGRVLPMVEEAFAPLPAVEVRVYAPLPRADRAATTRPAPRPWGFRPF